eukprot:351215-Chlamydomonas_euryale.AAC.1
MLERETTSRRAYLKASTFRACLCMASLASHVEARVVTHSRFLWECMGGSAGRSVLERGYANASLVAFTPLSTVFWYARLWAVLHARVHLPH